MDAFHDKKWFVYVGDHHEGPFSLGEIQSKITEGSFHSEQYVWCEGMADWDLMKQVDGFSRIIDRSNRSSGAGAVAGLMSNSFPMDALNGTASPNESFADDEQTGSLHAISDFQKASEAQAFEAPHAIETEITRSFSQEADAPSDHIHQGAPEMPVETLTPHSEARLSPTIDAKQLKEIEQKDKKRSKEEEKARIKAEKLAKKEAKKRRKEAEILGMSENGPRASAIGGVSFFSRILRFVAFLAIVGGVGFAYMEGHLDGLLSHPVAKDGVATVKNAIKPLYGTARPLFLRLTSQVPQIAEWVSPIELIPGLEPADFEALKKAAISRLEDNGPVVALALEKTSPIQPRIFLGTNLPDGARLDVFVVGVSETLLGHLEFADRYPVVTDKNVAVTPVIRFADGKPAPKGDYQIYVTEADGHQTPEVAEALSKALKAPGTTLPAFISKDKKILAGSTLFFGGTKDGQYLSRLKIFHDRLSQKARAEVTELRQFYSTLSSQLSLTQSRFDQFSRGPKTNAKVQQWKLFHVKWTRFYSQLNVSFMKWTPSFVQDNLFYGLIYENTRKVGESILQLHEIHNSYFSKRVDPQSFRTQAGESLTRARDGLNALKVVIERTEATLASSKGMPQRLWKNNGSPK